MALFVHVIRMREKDGNYFYMAHIDQQSTPNSSYFEDSMKRPTELYKTIELSHLESAQEKRLKAIILLAGRYVIGDLVSFIVDACMPDSETNRS